MRNLTAFTIAILLLSAATVAQAAAPASQPAWAGPMLAVHAKFTGKAGTVAQFGDSITYSKAFFANLFWGEFKGEPAVERFRKTVPKDCADWKGVKHANMGGWTVEQLAAALDAALKAENPEVALLMIGTNDLARQPDPAKKEFKEKLDAVVKKVLANGTVVVLHTVPPFKGKMPAAEAYNKVIKEVAEDNRVPLIDYCAEVLARRPDDWPGTLISNDGVHPSFPNQWQQDFTADGLKNSGYTLRNWLAVKMLYDLWDRFAAATAPSAAGKS